MEDNAVEVGPRGCTGRNAKGEVCKAAAIKGTALCNAHSGNLPGFDPEKAREAAAASAAVRQAKSVERRKTGLDRVAEKLEAHADVLLDKVVAAANEGDWRAVAWLYDRVHGKPVQPVKDETPDVSELTPEKIREMDQSERLELLRKLRESGSGLRAVS